MKNSLNSWLEWWNTENIITPSIWLNNMRIFISASQDFLNYGSQDIILDIGSGPGYLATVLKDKVKEIHCVDTSQRYLDLAKENFSQDANVFVYKLDRDNYTDLSILGHKYFSIIICQSVIQYYNSIQEVENLIKEVRKIALPGARFLISDIPTTNNTILLVYRFLKASLRSGRITEISHLLYNIANPKYRKAYSSLRLLTLSDEQLNELIERLDLDAKILNEKMTCNENRRHLLIRF